MSETLLLDEVLRLRTALRDLISEAKESKRVLQREGLHSSAEALDFTIVNAEVVLHG